MRNHPYRHIRPAFSVPNISHDRAAPYLCVFVCESSCGVVFGKFRNHVHACEPKQSDGKSVCSRHNNLKLWASPTVPCMLMHVDVPYEFPLVVMGIDDLLQFGTRFQSVPCILLHMHDFLAERQMCCEAGEQLRANEHCKVVICE